MARSASSNHNSTNNIRGRITKTKTVGRTSIRKRSSTSRNAGTNNKHTNARNRTRSAARTNSTTRSHLNHNNQKRSILGSKSKSQSSVRNIHPINNSAVRNGRSTNASRGIRRTKKTLSSAGARKKTTKGTANRLNTKKRIKTRNNNNNNNRERRQLGRNQQKKKKKTTSISSLISATPSNLNRTDDDFHRELNFETNE